MTDHLEINRRHWDERAPAHFRSPDYGVARFQSDPHYLSRVVRFDLPRLGDLSGLDVVHLQCHIGTDTVSLARLGARATGLDFSESSIAHARDLSRTSGTPAEFVVGDVHDAARILGEHRFDVVFTGIGALCWLPDIAAWSGVVADLLRPGGQLFLREGHPMLWALDESVTDRVVVGYPYFETSEPLLFDEPGTYVSVDTELAETTSASWNHALGETVTALLDRNFTITGLQEHDSVPWDALPGQMARDEHGEYRLQDHPERLAASYTLQAQLRA